MPDYSSVSFTPTTVPVNLLSSTSVHLVYDSRGIGTTGQSIILRLYPVIGGAPFPFNSTLVSTGSAFFTFSGGLLTPGNYNTTIEVPAAPLGFEQGTSGVLFNVGDPVVVAPGRSLFVTSNVNNLHIELHNCTVKRLTRVGSVEDNNPTGNTNALVIRNSIIDVTDTARPLLSSKDSAESDENFRVTITDSALPGGGS